MSNYHQKIAETAEFLKGNRADVILVLGSGLGDLVDLVENANSIPYSEIPNFTSTTVKGHSGKLVFGELFGAKVAVLCGRFHPYEGHSMAVSAFPIVVLNQLGAKRLICTNAAGGVNRSYNAGDIMLIADHLNLTGDNPFVGNHCPELGGEMFTDLTDCYCKDLRAKIKAKTNGIKEGVYAYRIGPVFETPAEVRMLEKMGADAVGMSTIPETLMAAHLKMQTIAFSLITNKAAGYDGADLDHLSVLDVGKKATQKLTELVKIAVNCF